MKKGIMNNCEKCGASYGQYNEEKDNDFSEHWCILPYRENEKLKTPKGLCQFCNPKTKFFILKE